MSRCKPQRDGWSSAQAPKLISGQVLADKPVSPAQKASEAERLRAEVEAHLAAGGTYMVISTPTDPKRRGRA